MSNHIQVVQGSDEWRNLRIGSLGASKIHEALARTKSGWGASRYNLQATIVCERLTGMAQESFQSSAMLHGIETEPEARVAYEFRTDATVEQVGLFLHPNIDKTHASPDGLVGVDGLIEIKCPASATHIDTLLSGKIPAKYETQMLWQMACSGRKWCDYVSYDPRLPESMRLFVKRLHRDDKRIEEITGEVMLFLNEINETVAKLTEKYGQAA